MYSTDKQHYKEIIQVGLKYFPLAQCAVFNIILYSQVIRWLYIEIVRFPQKTVIMMAPLGTVLNFTKEAGGIIVVINPI